MGDYCGGCNYHNFPYETTLPYLINGQRALKTFKNKDDVWNVIY